MNLLFRFMKWAISVVMFLTLLGGIFFLIATNLMYKALPKSLDALAPINATLRTVVVGENVAILAPNEYATQIEVIGEVANWQTANSRIKAGDKVEIYLQKEMATALSNKSMPVLPVMIGYGITLQNGEKLIDPSESISGNKERRHQRLAYKIIAAPVLYGLFQILFPILRRKYVARNRS